MKEIDEMDMLGFLRVRAWNSRNEHRKTEPQPRYISQREAIIVRYKLQPESETEGFQTILDKVNAEVARAQARSQNDADLSVYQNAVVAAAQGMKSESTSWITSK